ncbi:MAG: amidohydrolase family protein, partial [Acidobacteria bacterium]|nr:amidohydrolase family protein [Acidobacteriota bacterium]
MAIKNIRVFDGETVIPEVTVLIQDGVISAVGRDVILPYGTDVIDGTGKTLLPGFFDCHVHVWHADNLKQAAVFGVTTVVDMFMDVKTMTGIKKMQADGRATDRAWLISPGTLATAPGGHGTQYGLPIPTLTNPGDAEHWVSDRIVEDSDFIKIIWDDGSTYKMNSPTLDRETVAAIIHETHSRKKMVIIHAASLRQCMQAMEDGVDGLAHLYFENAFHPEFGRLAAEKGTFVIPTLAVLEGMHGVGDPLSLTEDPELSSFLTPDDRQMINMHSPLA